MKAFDHSKTLQIDACKVTEEDFVALDDFIQKQSPQKFSEHVEILEKLALDPSDHGRLVLRMACMMLAEKQHQCWEQVLIKKLQDAIINK
jgi:hypothetical protein